jgi:hypothetical protein
MNGMNDHQPIQAEFHAQMNAIASTLDQLFNGDSKGENRKVGFALLIFKTGTDDDRRANYISNCRREDMLIAMKEFIARNEGRIVEPTGKQ